ncbi:plasmid mobilization protein [Sphingobacterium thermophilum]|uniref:plasmid mobilization protein n=1 Tax=Sphingobacterium thermophilum TaxID=768534 RepID=UPI0031F1BA2B
MTINNKGGKPLSPHKKNHRINVRFDEQEYRLVLHNARIANMKKSEWVRKSAILKKITPRYTPEQLKVFRDFTGVANNLNQLTKKAHQIGLSQMTHECQNTINHINRCVNKLLEHGGENH